MWTFSDDVTTRDWYDQVRFLRAESQGNGVIWIRYDKNESLMIRDKSRSGSVVCELYGGAHLGMFGWLEMSCVFTVSTAC